MITNPGRELRTILDRTGSVIAPGAYDGISARLVEEAGFNVLYRTGAGASASLLGEPDLGLITLAEMADHAARIADCVRVPVIADADSGYGNVLNVVRTVHAFERAGVAAIHLEDQVFPKRCGFMSGKEVVSREEFSQKIKAAVSERQSRDFMIFARTDAYGIEGLGAAIDRCKHYIDAGADGIFFHVPETIAEMETAARDLNHLAPVIVNFPPSGIVSVEELEAMGFKIIIFPGICMYAALAGMRGALGDLARRCGEYDAKNRVPAPIGPMELFRAVGLEKWKEIEERYKSEAAPTAR